MFSTYASKTSFKSSLLYPFSDPYFLIICLHFDAFEQLLDPFLLFKTWLSLRPRRAPHEQPIKLHHLPKQMHAEFPPSNIHIICLS